MIAGSIVFIQFDRHALLEELQSVRQGDMGVTTKRGLFQQDADDTDYSKQAILLPAANAEDSVVGVSTWGHQMISVIANRGGSFVNFDDLLNQTYHRVKPWYSDQLPPLHITITMAN